jgi:hypothetical protein
VSFVKILAIFESPDEIMTHSLVLACYLSDVEYQENISQADDHLHKHITFGMCKKITYFKVLVKAFSNKKMYFEIML